MSAYLQPLPCVADLEAEIECCQDEINCKYRLHRSRYGPCPPWDEPEGVPELRDRIFDIERIYLPAALKRQQSLARWATKLMCL